MNKIYMMQLILITALTVMMTAVVAQACAQTCRCEEAFEWMKTTFEQKDAGFQYIIDRKGQDAYDLHNTMMLGNVRRAKSHDECNPLLSEWLLFFRTEHLRIQPLSEPAVSENADVIPHEIWNGDMNEAVSKWTTPGDVFTFGVAKEGDGYVGFIIESKVDSWKPREVKFRIVPEGERMVTYYYFNHLPWPAQNVGQGTMIGKNYVEFENNMMWKRLDPVFESDAESDTYYNTIYNNIGPAIFTELNSTMVYLRIPSFAPDQKPAIDKVITDNREKILSTENLIIDLRFNTGGGDASFEELLPIIYTDPVRIINEEFRLEDGSFTKVSDEDVSIYRQDEVYEYPRNVGIVINEGNMSTTEQFLLAAKQSKKVKLFGTSTRGALDVSNMAWIDSPDGAYRLWYGTSRSLRIPGMTIDGVGIQPDYYLDKSIPHSQWVNFVNETLNNN